MVMMFTKNTFVGFLLGSVSVFVYMLIKNSNEIKSTTVSSRMCHEESGTVQANKKILECFNKEATPRVQQRGRYWVLLNHVKAEKEFECQETITLTAPGDYRFLDNVPPLVKDWQGPISIALYAPGSDFKATLDSIAYLRNCETPLIRDLVTFHLFFEEQHLPLKGDKSLTKTYTDTYNCGLGAPFSSVPETRMYKFLNNLTYPINVARNIARETARTFFIFPSDIELFPTPDFIKHFLDMIKRRPNVLKKIHKTVFVMPVFEILEDQKIPANKMELQRMFKEKKAFLFHERICKLCHKVIKGDVWLKTEETKDLEVFIAGKRQGPQVVWEPFYVSTNREPLFDERLTWEGQSNKMSQAYSLCLLDYDFAVLNNAFLTHKPGIKKEKVQVQKHLAEIKKTKTTLRTIKEELIHLYGNNPKCKIAFHI